MSEKRVKIEHLSESLWEMSKDPEVLDDMLKDEGYNPVDLESKAISKVKRLLFKTRVDIKKEASQLLYKMALQKFQTAASDTKENLLSLLRQRAPSLQFRNFENLDEEMVRQVLDETELLDIMNKIEKGEI